MKWQFFLHCQEVYPDLDFNSYTLIDCLKGLSATAKLFVQIQLDFVEAAMAAGESIDVTHMIKFIAFCYSLEAKTLLYLNKIPEAKAKIEKADEQMSRVFIKDQDRFKNEIQALKENILHRFRSNSNNLFTFAKAFPLMQ